MQIKKLKISKNVITLLIILAASVIILNLVNMYNCNKYENFTVSFASPGSNTTKASTTKASTTKASTTKASTTKASTTKANTTKANTTKASTTKASTTINPNIIIAAEKDYNNSKQELDKATSAVKSEEQKNNNLAKDLIKITSDKKNIVDKENSIKSAKSASDKNLINARNTLKNATTKFETSKKKYAAYNPSINTTTTSTTKPITTSNLTTQFISKSPS